MGLFEINEAAEIISQAADPDANVIFGAVIDESLEETIRVTVIATGFDAPRAAKTHLRSRKNWTFAPPLQITNWIYLPFTQEISAE